MAKRLQGVFYKMDARFIRIALVAQLAEHVLGKDEVTGSIPVEGSSCVKENGGKTNG